MGEIRTRIISNMKQKCHPLIRDFRFITCAVKQSNMLQKNVRSKNSAGSKLKRKLCTRRGLDNSKTFEFITSESMYKWRPCKD